MSDVLVIGAGPTGLALACQLARRGVSLRIVDDRVDRARESRAFGVQARSMEIFDDLGVAPAFLAVAKRADPVRIVLHGHASELPFDQLGDDTRFNGLYLVPQPTTERILLRHLAERGVAVQRPVRLRGFREDDGRVTAELEHLADGTVEIATCRYLVGCDGAHSRVRETLAVPFAGATYVQELLLADVTARVPDSLTLYLGRRGLALVGTVGELVRVMGYRFDVPARTDDPSPAEVVELLEAADAPIAFDSVEWLSRFRLHHRATRVYGRGRAFLAGDACHIHSPVGGQGMNTGIQDATNLGWKLAAVLRGAPAALLDTYASERQPVGAKLVHTTDRAFGLVTSARPAVRWVRDHVAPWLVPLLLRWRPLGHRIARFASQLDIRYHASAIVRAELTEADDAFRRGLPEGCRLPDLALGDTTLHELVRGQAAHVLALGPCDTAALAALDRRHAASAVVHRMPAAADAPELYRRLGVTSAAIFVVRPDGHVGFRSYGPTVRGAARYLDDVFGVPRVHREEVELFFTGG